jgi:hypothetical protein
MLKSIIATGILTLSSAAYAQEPDVINIAHTIWIHESGSFLGKTFHEMDTPEFTGAMTAVCSAFQCEEAVPVIAEAIHVTQPVSGGDFYTTGRIDKQAGEEWWIAFPAPAGYVACNATVLGGVGKNGGDSSSGIIFRNPGTGENWLGSYNEVPKNRPEGHWVDAHFVVKYVRAGTEGSHECVPSGTHIWG